MVFKKKKIWNKNINEYVWVNMTTEEWLQRLKEAENN